MAAKVPPRLIGLLLLAAAGCTTLVHRSLYEAARHGPAQVAEMALGLLTFMLASTGILMLIHGGGLFEGKLDRAARRSADPHPDTRPLAAAPPASIGDAYDSRRGVALLQARQAIAAAQRAAGPGHEPIVQATPPATGRR